MAIRKQDDAKQKWLSLRKTPDGDLKHKMKVESDYGSINPNRSGTFVELEKHESVEVQKIQKILRGIQVCMTSFKGRK